MEQGTRSNDLLTSGEVARMVGVSVDTIRDWSNAGRLPVERTASGMRLYRRDDVERFLREREAAR